MNIEVVTPGLFTCIQDMGREGMASYGVPFGGVMDRYAAIFANSLIKNQKRNAVMEITLTGPKLKFHGDTEVAISGLGAEVFLNGETKKVNEIIPVKKNDLLDIRRVTAGCRLYLAVRGGFLTEKVLGSRSMLKGITRKEKIEKGDKLRVRQVRKRAAPTHASMRFNSGHYLSDQINAVPGPEFPCLSSEHHDLLFGMEFHLSPQCNRMAYLLDGLLKNDLEPILTGPVLPGTVQLTPEGRLIILMNDCQITGGYPRILQLTGESMLLLAQKKPGDTCYFEEDKKENLCGGIPFHS